MKTMGQRIQELRKYNKMTGEELGKKLNVAKSTVSFAHLTLKCCKVSQRYLMFPLIIC